VLDISAFQPGKPNSRIDLWYIAGKREHHPVPATVERDFFLQCIRDQARGLPQCRTRLSRMLGLVSAAWDRAGVVARHVRGLNVVFPTVVTKVSDCEIAVRCTLVLVPLASKVEVVLGLRHDPDGKGDGDVEVDVVPRAEVVYGESFKVDKIAEFLATRIGTKVKGPDEQGESWVDVVAELHGRLVARGRK
jgi:kinetochore protein Spc7/SPC105